MKLINFACALESFRIEASGSPRTGPDATGLEMRIEGWLVGHPTPACLELVFGGDRPVSFAIHDRGRDSGDVALHFGSVFAEATRTCRFLLVAPLPSRVPDWNEAALRMTGEDGTMIDIRLDPPENLALVRDMRRPDRDLVARFESCGDNGEFGSFQCRIGVARPALLRHANIADVFALAHAIESRFAGFAEGEALQLHAYGSEWVAALPALRLNLHTGRAVDASVAPARVRIEERRKLRILAGRFIDDLESGNTIFVYRTRRDRRGGRDGRKGMDRLFDAMRAIGPARLLWVNEADRDHPPGTVIERRPGLYHGHVARLAPHGDAVATDAAGWLALLAAAAGLIDAASAAPAPDPAAEDDASAPARMEAATA